MTRRPPARNGPQEYLRTLHAGWGVAGVAGGLSLILFVAAAGTFARGSGGRGLYSGRPPEEHGYQVSAHWEGRRLEVVYDAVGPWTAGPPADCGLECGGVAYRHWQGTGLFLPGDCSKGYAVALPWWVVFPALLALPCVSLAKALRPDARLSRLLAGLCPVCGYDLRATPARCPECGADPRAATGRRGNG